MTAIAFVVFATEPIPTAARDRAAHGQLRRLARIQQSKRPAVKVERRPQPLQQHLITIRQQLDSLHLMLTVLVAMIAGALGGGLIAGLLSLLLTRPRSPRPPPPYI